MSEQLYRRVLTADGWSAKTWSGLTNFTPSNIWSDGNNIYYSAVGSQYMLDRATNTWIAKTWNGFSPSYAYAIWSDGDNIYYSYRSDQYVLDKATSTWSAKTWNGFYPNNITSDESNYVWSDGTNTYWSKGTSQQYMFNKNTAEWEAKTWNGLTDLSDFKGNCVWTDGDDIYYSGAVGGYLAHYVLDKETDTWIPKTWKGITNFNGRYVWSDGENTYCCNDVSHESYQLILDKTTGTWLPKTWNSSKQLSSGISYKYVWSDGVNTYYSTGSNHYVLDMLTAYKPAAKQLYERKSVRYPGKWSPTAWNGSLVVNGSLSIEGGNIWSDGEYIYYSKANTGNYIFNKRTGTWETKAWNGLTDIYGYGVWSDGDSVYYSNGTNQYVLDKATSTWSAKIWNGLTDFIGDCIWSDGEYTYYSNGYDAKQYVLDKATSTWTAITWNGLTDFNGFDIWSDGENIYYSRSSDHYILDKSTRTWTAKTWNGLTSFYGQSIWTAGGKVYSSTSAVVQGQPNKNQYVLDKATDSWLQITWSGNLPSRGIDGSYIWSDDEDIYYSNGSDQLILDKVASYEPATIPEPVEVPPSMKVKDRGGIWYPVKGVSVKTHGGSGPADVASLPPTGAYISSYDPCLAFLGIDEMPKHIGTNYSDVNPWEDCSGEYISEQKAYLSGSPYDGPNNIGDWYFLKVGDKVLAKSSQDSGFAPLIEFTEVPVTNMSLIVGGAAASPGSVLIMEGDSPAVQVTTGSDSTKQYYYCNSDWFSYISEDTTDSIGSAYVGGNTLLIEIDPTNRTIGIAKYVYEAGN